MAEQLPKAGRKVPGLASRMPGCLADVGSRPLPGLQLGRNAKERGPSPSLPRQDSSEFGVLGFPPPHAKEIIPLAPPYSSISSISALFPFRYSCLPPQRSSGPSPQPPPLLLHQIPACPLAPSQFTVGTADVTPLPSARNLSQELPGILVLGSPSAGTSPFRALVLGTRGCLRALPGSRGGSGSSLRHARCPWAAGVGGGEVLVGTLRSWRRASSLAVLRLRDPGSEPLSLKPAPRGWDDPAGKSARLRRP